MSASTSIEWTRGDDGAAGATWNPVTGCKKVSEGCDNCYAETFAERWRGIPGHPFEQGFDIRLWPDRLKMPLQWRKPKRVFVNSMSDLFIGQGMVPDAFIAAVWATMYRTCGEARGNEYPVHTYQILTKRPAPMRSWMRRWADGDERRNMLASAAEEGWVDGKDVDHADCMPIVLPNVWLGVSVETNRWARIRLPQLVESPAAVRFVSCEPLLGTLDLRPWLGAGIDWVIVGGESGPKARPMHPDWARSLRDQCKQTKTPFLFKQWGAYAPESDGHSRGALASIDRRGRIRNPEETLSAPDLIRMRRAGKGKAGRMLDGRTWDEFPVGKAPHEGGPVSLSASVETGVVS